MRRRGYRHLSGFLSLAVASFLLAGCVTNSEVGLPEGWTKIEVDKNDDAARLVPQEIRDRGFLRVGTNAPFAPYEFKDDNGNIIGTDVDLVTAAAKVLGLGVEIRQAEFDSIIPGVSTGMLDVGATGSSDTAERREVVDFVDYLSSGIQWATRTDNPMDPSDPCGKIISVQRTTESDTTDVPAQEQLCREQGKPGIGVLRLETQDDSALATILGRSVAFSADAPVAAYTVRRSNGRLKLIGPVRYKIPIGWEIKKGSSLTQALQRALQILIDGGQYRQILKPWGLEDEAVTTATINAQPVVPEVQQ